MHTHYTPQTIRNDAFYVDACDFSLPDACWISQGGFYSLAVNSSNNLISIPLFSLRIIPVTALIQQQSSESVLVLCVCVCVSCNSSQAVLLVRDPKKKKKKKKTSPEPHVDNKHSQRQWYWWSDITDHSDIDGLTSPITVILMVWHHRSQWYWWSDITDHSDIDGLTSPITVILMVWHHRSYVLNMHQVIQTMRPVRIKSSYPQLNESHCHPALSKEWLGWAATPCEWGLCALHHWIQSSMEAILTCHPAVSTEWLAWVANSHILWRTRTAPVVSNHTFAQAPFKFIVPNWRSAWKTIKRTTHRRVSHNVVTMATSAIGWPLWFITFWYLWIWRNHENC